MSPGIDWLALVVGLLGGMALLLFGLDQMSSSLRSVAGHRLRGLLQALSRNRLVGLLTGAGVTAVIQSSSATTVMLVGFVSAGLMDLTQALGIVLGANIGTTVTAQLLAFKVSRLALLFVALGFLPMYLSRRPAVRQWGAVTFGLSLILYGMSVMSAAVEPLRELPAFREAMLGLTNPLLGVLIGAVVAAVIHASAATTGLVIALASQGLIQLETGISIMLGANIGTTLTAAMAAMGKPAEARRVALAHTLVNLAGALVLLPLLPWYADLVRQTVPYTGADLDPLVQRAHTVPRQIANADTLFNLGTALLFLPFIKPFTRLVAWMVPDRPDARGQLVLPRRLDPLLMQAPPLALAATRAELEDLGQMVLAQVRAVLPAVIHGTDEELDAIAARDGDIDRFHATLVQYLGRLSRQSLAPAQTRELMELMSAANDLEAIGDVVETDMVSLGRRRRVSGVVVSPVTRQVLHTLHGVVLHSVEEAIAALVSDDAERARRLLAAQGEVSRLAEAAERHQAERLIAPGPRRVEAYTFEIDLIDRLRRCHDHARRIAGTLVQDPSARVPAPRSPAPPPPPEPTA